MSHVMFTVTSTQQGNIMRDNIYKTGQCHIFALALINKLDHDGIVVMVDQHDGVAHVVTFIEHDDDTYTFWDVNGKHQKLYILENFWIPEAGHSHWIGEDVRETLEEQYVPPLTDINEAKIKNAENYIQFGDWEYF